MTGKLPEVRDTLPSCLVCESKALELYDTSRDIEYFSVEELFSYFRCVNCSAIHIYPVPEKRLREIYPDNYYSFSHGLDSPIYKIKQWLDSRILRKLLAGMKGKSLNVLDVGGGTGWQLNLIKDIDPRTNLTQVVDIDARAESEATSRGHRYFLGKIEDFESTEKFDLILLLNLIEHVRDPVEVLRKLETILTDQGLILVKTPNSDSLDARLFHKRNWAGLHCPRHWVIFTKESFEIAAIKARLKLKEFQFTQGAPFWSGSIMNWLSTRGFIKVDRDNPMLSHWLSMPLLAFFAAIDFIRLPFSKTSQMFVVLEKEPRTP